MAITKGVSVLTHNGEDMAINDANVAHEFDQASAYAIGDHVTYCGKLYCFHAPHAANAAWDYTKVREILIGDEVTAVKNNLTVPFDETVSYSAGWYTYYQPDQALYRFTVDHAAGAWNYSHVVRVTVGDEIIRNRTETDSAVADLKSAIGTVPIGRTVQGQITDHGTRITTLEGDMTDAKRDIDALDSEFIDLSVRMAMKEPDATEDDVGKALIAKTVNGNKVIEYEYGETTEIDDTAGEGDTDKTWSADKLSQIEPGLTNAAKVALLACFAHTAWVDEHGQDYYDALEAALYNDVTIVSISAVFNSNEDTIYTGDSLDYLRQYLAVTAIYSNGSTAIVSDYVLTGTLSEGTNTITASVGTKTTTFNVTAVFGYKLRMAYSSTDELIDTGITPNDGAYTIACEFNISSVPSQPDICFVVGCIRENQSPYLAIQVTQDWKTVKYLWGFGITWDNGSGLAVLNKKTRTVITFDSSLSSVSISQSIKIEGSSKMEFIRTDDKGQRFDTSFRIGYESVPNNAAFNVNDLIIVKGTWSSNQIDDYLNG